MKYLEKNKNKTIVAKAYPARASVILHYYSFLKKYIKYIAEQSNFFKNKSLCCWNKFKNNRQ